MTMKLEKSLLEMRLLAPNKSQVYSFMKRCRKANRPTDPNSFTDENENIDT